MRFAAPNDPSVLRDGMDRNMATVAAASTECLRSIAAYDKRKLWRQDGATSMSSWLAARYSLAWGTAREWVRVAQALRRLPRIARTYASGRLSWDQLQPLTKFATSETDEVWARKACGLRPSSLWREARRHQKARVRDANQAHRDRYLFLSWDHERPVLWLEGMLPAEEGVRLEGALRDRSERIPPDPEATDPSGARMADALLNMVSGDPQPATMVVHAGAEALTKEEPDRGPWLAETEGGHRLASESVRRLACDSQVEWVLESGGRPVGIGRRGRSVRGQLLRVLHHRDEGTCRFPGCEHKRWLHAHHVVHWADGGSTNLDNLVLLCGGPSPPDP
jgi:hypothetical protein